MKICVSIFAGSRLPRDPAIIAAAEELGVSLARAGIGMNYGGGITGVMGKVAQAAVVAGGTVRAVDIDRYAGQEQIPGVEVILERNENTRFSTLCALNNPAALIMLPGGPGAAREAMAGIEQAVYDGGPPVFLLKVGGYLDGLQHYFDQSLAQGLIPDEHHDKLRLLTAAEIVKTLQKS